MGHEHERPVEPFADLHVEHGHIRATLLHDPTVEGLDMAIYMDGSGSMNDEYQNEVERKGGGLLWDLFGWGPAPTTEVHDNQVEPQVRWMLQYLASKDRNGLLRVAYWATGPGGADVEYIGELDGVDVGKYKFPGPSHPGRSTRLLPAIRDFVEYYRRQVRDGAKQGCAVFVTDGQLHDADDVKAYSRQIASQIADGQLPRLNFVLVGVGDGVDEEQLEQVCHEEYPGVGHLWCHRIAEEIKEVAELVAVLVDETMTVAAGGLVYDDRGQIVKRYEGRLPAVLEFEVPEGTTSFTLEVNGQRYTQPLPADDDDHDDDSDDGDHD
ncbi:MAG: VWA domain-containing protein [Myxococcota bacterium]